MNKKELIARVQRYMGPGATRNTASAAVEAVLASIIQGAQTGKVHISHLGTFEFVLRPERIAFNACTANKITIPERSHLVFRPSKDFPLTRKLK